MAGGVARSHKLVESRASNSYCRGETMKALLLYVGLVIVGAVLSALLGIYLERTISSTVSLIVFLGCFFANFVVSWIIVIYIMDGTLKKSQA
jgi:uncharacterized membrane protein (DUF485 family)